jgi:hypothetical protein
MGESRDLGRQSWYAYADSTGNPDTDHEVKRITNLVAGDDCCLVHQRGLPGSRTSILA